MFTSLIKQTTRIFPATILRLLLVFALFQLTRIGFYLLNFSLFSDVSFSTLLGYLKAGFLFDTTAILYTNLLFLISSLLPFTFRYRAGYQMYLKIIFILFNSVALMANIADIIYYRFTLRRSTADVFGFIASEEKMAKMWGQFLIDYWYALLFFVAIVFLLFYGWRRIKLVSYKPKQAWVYFSSSLIVFVLSLGLMVAGLRGGFRHSTRPITISNVGKYIKKPEHASLVLNTPFCIYRTLDKPTLDELHYYSDEELRGIFNPVHEPSDSAFEEMNVLVIILESFTREMVGFLNKDLSPDYKGYTPFLDSLMQESVVFSNAYANGRKSIDAIPAIAAGIPAMSLPYVLTPYSNNNIKSMASCLNEQNYETAFFHGAPNGSMGFDSFCKTAGFKWYYGLNEFGNDEQFDGMWGVWDEPMFQFMKQTLDSFQSPFYSMIFSISSHHPFRVPEKYKNTFPKGPLPLYECAGYTDYALKRFFSEAKKSPWFNNTLFIITADHSTQFHHPEYETSVGAFSIPIMFYKPNSLSHKVIEHEVMHTDIFPTVMRMMNSPSAYVAFGNDMLNDSIHHFAINYLGNSFQLIKDGRVIQIAEDEVVGLYNLENDRLMEHNLVGSQKEREYEMVRLFKAYKQQYNNRLINNNLVEK